VRSLKEKFKNKKILITGASQGLGLVCSQYFDQWGSQLVITGRSTEKLEKIKQSFTKPSQHLAVTADLTLPEDITRLSNNTTAFLEEIDVIIHCAGGGYGFHDVLLNWNQFNILHMVNLASAVELNRLLIPEMIKRKVGNVVHVGSIASQEAVASVGYNTVKAGLAGYVRSLGRELAASGVIVTGILPGSFYAPGNSWSQLEAKKPELVKQIVESRLPRKRIADAKELIPLLSLLASDEASMMSGSCVPIDAGEGKGYLAI